MDDTDPTADDRTPLRDDGSATREEPGSATREEPGSATREEPAKRGSVSDDGASEQGSTADDRTSEQDSTADSRASEQNPAVSDEATDGGTADETSVSAAVGRDTPTRRETPADRDGDTSSDGHPSSPAGRQSSLLRRPSSLLRQVLRRTTPASVRESYPLKLLVAVVLIVLLVGASGVYVQSQLSERLQTDVNEQLLAQTQADSEEVAAFVADYRVPTVLLSNHPALGTTDAARLRAFFERKRGTLPPGVTAFHVVNRDSGRVVWSSSSALSPGETPSRPWLGETSPDSHDTAAVTEPYANARGTVVLGFVSPVAESPSDVLVVTVAVDGMEGAVESTTQGGFTQVVTADGTVLFAEEESARLEPYLSGDETAAAVRRGRADESGVIRESRREQTLSADYVQAYAPVRGTDWVVIEHAPASSLYSLDTAVTRGILLLVGVTLLAVVAVGGAVGRDTVDAVTTLRERVDAIEAGEYDVDIPRRRDDEIGELFAAVGRVRDRLRERAEEAATARERARTASEKLQRRSAEIQEQKAMISVLNRFLRHNLRNRLNVMLGHLELLDPDTPPELRRQRRERLRETVDDLLDKAEKARSVESLASGETETETVDVSALLEEEVERCRDEYPEARITEEIDPALTANAHGTLRVVFENLVENAVLHNNNPVPEVRVSASLVEGTGPQRTSTDEQRDDSDLTGCAGSEQREAEVVVRIADDGPGIPQPEIDALEEEYETALTHASGIGLWITNWIVSEFDGELTFDRREPTGTVVTIRLPAA
jgi:signal transduction histidine kinase